jgi:hypothetical protein
VLNRTPNDDDDIMINDPTRVMRAFVSPHFTRTDEYLRLVRPWR